MSTTSEQRLLRSGAVVAEKYRIDKAIARGGFSIVYRGTHIEMQRPVGLKVLTINDDIQASWLERFTREARLASQLTHPNTVTIYDYGQDPRGFLYITMEWVEGVSLYQHLNERGALGALAVARISVQILESLQEAHQRNFLHRDLKPSNIMLTRDYQGADTVKVLDFGIAKDLSEAPDSSARITHQGAFVGTPRYASPEQLEQSASLGPASDIYSLGLLMWEALLGDPAVPSTSYADCVTMHLGDTPWQLPESVFCPMGFERILYKALAKDPARRYQSCEAMRRELLTWLNTSQAKEEEKLGELFAAPPPASPQPPPLPKPPLPKPRAPLQPSARANPAPSAPVLDDLLVSNQRRPNPRQATAPLNIKPDLEPAVERDIAPDNPGAHRADARGARSGAKRMTPPALIAAAVAAGVLLIALTWWARTASEPTDDAPPVTEFDAPAPEDSPPPRARPQPPAGTYSPALIWAATQESGWQRIGKISTFQAGAITQENGRFRRKGKTVALTVYSTDDFDEMPDYSEITEPPTQVLDLGTTVVQLTPGTPSGSDEGVYELMGSLRKLKEIAEAQAHERARADDAP